jgi:S1-C subfamily serine protease
LLQIGDKVDIEYYRGDEKKEATAVIGKQERPQQVGEQLHSRLQGIVLGNSQRDQVEGVVIEKINTASYAWKIGLRPGDVIVSANQYRVHNLAELKEVVEPKSGLLLNVQRGQESFLVMLN